MSTRKALLLFRSIVWLLLLNLFSQFIIAQAPVANFTATPTTGCSPLSVQFQDLSTGDPVFWNWDLGNGQLSTLQNPTGVYTTPGTYTIQLVVRNADGIDGITKTGYIVVNPSPTAGFTSDITIGCVPATIQFTDQSNPQAGVLTQWLWDFGDGTTSTLQNPQKTYNATGFYTVSLAITSSTGCRASIAVGNYIRVVSGVTANFSFTNPTTCKAPFNISFTNLTSGPGTLSYQWDFGNSTTSTLANPVASYNSAGVYTVKLTAQSQYGCSGSIQKNITIPTITSAINSPDSVCLNSTVYFQNASTPLPVSSAWNFGNGSRSIKMNDSTTYSAPGIYTIKLVNTYSNCTDSVFKNVVARNKPTVDFTANNVIGCKAPFIVNFQDLSPDASGWQWNFGDGATSNQKNPSHQYNSEGQFNVTLTITDSKGCRNTLTKTTFIRIVRPTVNISNAPAGGCIPFTFNPIPVVNSIDGVSTYFWDFGDGATSTLPNPSHTYPSAGNYTIKLVITTNGGCTDSIVIVNGVRTGTPPTVDFSAAPLNVCASTAINFTDLSPVSDAWLWNFGDGGTSTQQNPQYNYTDTGYFSVTLTAFSNGCGQSFTRAQYVHILPPTAHFTYQVACLNKRQVNFTNTSKTDPSFGPISYLWEFGDAGNSTSTATNPVFTYPTIGTYTVKLTVTNGSCTHSYPYSIKLNGDIADFTVSKLQPCKYENINITAINSDPSNIARYEWSFDSGPFGIMPGSITQSYATNGAHTITLAIMDINGCTDTLTKNPAVNVTGPTANFMATNNGGCRNANVTFNDLSTPAGSLRRWTWDFGDGQTQTFTATPFTHQYADTGTYSVKLKAEDMNGCYDTITLPAAVLITQPKAAFSVPAAVFCPGINIPFIDSSSGAQLSYQWDFGDGNTSIGQNPSHSYAGTDSMYRVKLIIRDSVGCKDSVTHDIPIRIPKPAFVAKDTTSICPPLETKFTFRGKDYESFSWDFGDGITSTLTDPNHFYNNYGTYTAKLFLTGYGGCIDSSTININVYNPYTTSSMNFSPLTGCNSLLVDFNITTPPHTYLVFYAADGFVDTSQSKSFQHFYKTFGYYTPAMVISDSLKCSVSIGSSSTIRILGAEPLFGIDKKAFCDTGTVLFANFTIGNDPIVSSTWDFGDGNTSTVKDPSHRYNIPGIYYPSLTVTTQAGCTKTLADTVRVYVTPNPIISSDSIACINESLDLQGSLTIPDSLTIWHWEFGNGTGTNYQNTTVIYNKVGTYSLLLEASNKIGCKGSASKKIMVPPTPIINILNNPVIPVSTGITLPVTYGPGIATYNWTPVNNISCIDCPTPFANPKSTTRYKVTVTDIYGCQNSNEITVVVICNDQNFFIPNTFSPNNDGNNDVFYPRGIGIARIQTMRIYNRWGEVVFDRKNFAANDPSLGWDGTYKGKKVDADVYVYVIELICENSLIIPYKGNVALIR